MQRRQELHRLIGQAIEELYADRLAEQYEVLAYHFAKGEAWAKALAYFCQAAEKARRPLPPARRWPSMTRPWKRRAISAGGRPAKTLMAIYQAKADLYFVLSDLSVPGRKASASWLWLGGLGIDERRQSAGQHGACLVMGA